MRKSERKLTYKDDGVFHNVNIILTSDSTCFLRVPFEGKNEQVVEADDFYSCFRKLMELNPSITFFCKGAKINVLPSRMTRQMTSGLSAYETTLGKQARKEDLVDIFDYEDTMLVSDPLQLDKYQKEWFSSLNN